MSTPGTVADRPAAAWLHPARWSPAGWTLRTRLVATLVALLAGTALVIGSVSVLALDRYLTNQLHQDLTSAAQRSQNDLGRPHNGPDEHDGPSALQAPGQGAGTLGANVRGGAIVNAAVFGSDGTQIALSDSARATLLSVPVDDASHAVDLGGSLGSYLVVAMHQPNGDTVLTGLPMAGVNRAIGWLAVVVTLVALSGLLIAAGLGSLLVRRSLRPLQRVAATAGRVSELPLERGDVALAVRVPDVDTDPRTEVGQVGAALNRMLGHISSALQIRQASEARMRRFVADASHELRTPLASIRGYAELTRHRGDDLPTEITHALRRVESEAVRMTGLVEDLLLLARLDESAQAASLRQDDVDLTAVVVDCVSDAHLLGPQHLWRLDLPDEPVSVTGDAARLRQVLTNLLGNARVHTPGGTTVTVRLRRRSDDPSTGRPDGVVLEVEDDGPGIPADLVPEVFDRFTRADSSRSRAAGSTGLGLSIVASVVEAHGGRVEVSSRAGRTTFRVLLPATVATPDAGTPDAGTPDAGGSGAGGAGAPSDRDHVLA